MGRMGAGWGRRGGDIYLINGLQPRSTGVREKRQEKTRKVRWKERGGEWSRYRIEHPLESNMETALTGRHRRSESQTLEGKRARAHHMKVHPGHSETLKGGISHTSTHKYTVVGGGVGWGGGQGFREQTNTPRGFTRRNHCVRASLRISHED